MDQSLDAVVDWRLKSSPVLRYCCNLEVEGDLIPRWHCESEMKRVSGQIPRSCYELKVGEVA